MWQQMIFVGVLVLLGATASASERWSSSDTEDRRYRRPIIVGPVYGWQEPHRHHGARQDKAPTYRRPASSSSSTGVYGQPPSVGYRDYRNEGYNYYYRRQAGRQ